MKYAVIIDGTNFICRVMDILDDDRSINNFCEKFSLNHLLKKIIQGKLHEEFGNAILTQGIEFFYSQKILGSKKKKLTQEQSDKLISRFSEETAVYLRQINISSNNEKGIDIAVATRMIEISEICDIICLIASDKDYIPVLEYLKRKGKYIVTVGINESHPTELKNLSYLYIGISGWINNFKNNS